MSKERYPQDLTVTAEHFANSGWKEAIDGVKDKNYSAMWSALSSAARHAMSADKTAEGKVLWLLADAASMMLEPKRHNAPFTPYYRMSGKRSALPEDFSAADIEFFAEIAGRVEDARLRGRLADLAWICSKSRDRKHALMAIDAYRELNLDAKTWINNGGKCWERAIRLALTLGAGSGDRIDEMRDAILKAFHTATTDDADLALWLSDLLDKQGRVQESDFRPLGEHLETLAKNFESSGDLPRCRDYFERASRWFKKAGDAAKSAEMTVALAEGWARQARASAGNSSHVAATFYGKAIQAYRTIPRPKRGPYQVDERIGELRGHLNKASEKSLGEMNVISVETDISKIIKQAQDGVRDKKRADALGAFANLYRADTKTIRASAIGYIRRHPLSNLMPTTVLSRDGRVIAKRPGMNDEGAIEAGMIEHYQREINVAVTGLILPALEILMQEHRLQENDFADLCRQSPIVPIEREKLWAKALYAGYDHDFVTAIHLLCPQMEHMVRQYLKAVGAQTTTLSQDGIETENGLGTLMEMPEIKKILGPDLTFEIKALFCSPFGPNLRNEVAHGLLSLDDFRSVYSVYAWWLGMRLVFDYWNAAHQANVSQSSQEDP